MLRVKQSAEQQRQRRRSRHKPESVRGDWVIDMCDAEFTYLHVRTADPNACTNTASVIEVTSIEATTEKFLTGGGSVVRGKLLIPGIGSLITCRDSVGQEFTFMEEESPVNPEKPTF